MGPRSILLTLALGVLVSCASVSSAAPATSSPEATDVASLSAAASGVPTASLPPGAAVSVREGSAALDRPKPAAALPSPTLQREASDATASLDAAPTALPTASPTPEATTAPEAPSTPEPTPSPQPTPEAPSTPDSSPSPQPTLEATSTAAASPDPSDDAAVRADRAGSGGLDARTQRQLRRILRTQVSKKGVAGLQAAVLLRDGRMWLGTAGMAEYTPPRTIADDTPFAIASVTKTFIAALILQLHEEGKLDLDEPFGTYEPLAPRGRRTTIRQLLSHTSGMYNYFEHPRYWRASGDWLRASPKGVGDRDHRWTYEEILGLVKAGYCKPGRCYHYSNTNYVILGKVAEAAGGAPLHKLLRRRFFRPLGMRDSYYQPEEQPPLDAAHGHWPAQGGGHDDHTRDARVIPFMAAASVASSAGAIASTAKDLAIWADALYGGRVLSPGSLQEMTRILPDGTYGLGTDVAIFAGHLGYGHRGGLRGFEASMWHFPGSGATVVLLSNQGNWTTDIPMQRLVRAALGRR